MTQPHISFIGAGNMGASIIGGLIADGYPAEHLTASNVIAEPLQTLKKSFNIQTTTDNQAAIKQADIVVIAVKPAHAKAVATDIAAVLKPQQLIMSIVAGVRVKQLEQWIGQPAAIVRVMPNTPALVGCGASGLFANQAVSPAQKELAETIMRSVGITEWVENEELIDVITAVSGSGPAYFLLVMEAMFEAATTMGLDPKTAKLLIMQTALGSAKMAMESEQELSSLRQNVTSPGGTTEAALKVLAQGDIKNLFINALDAAKQRAQELAGGLS